MITLIVGLIAFAVLLIVVSVLIAFVSIIPAWLLLGLLILLDYGLYKLFTKKRRK